MIGKWRGRDGEMITRCSKGHWYDTSVNKECPHCKQAGERLGIQLNDIEEDDKTVSLTEVDPSLEAEIGNILNTSAVQINGGLSNEDDDKTIAFGFFGVTETSPVTGWLICMNGTERGRDYRLHAGKNFIGRSTSMDVLLAEDKTIARDKHCSVIYDPKGNEFYISGEGGNMVYLNGQMLDSSTPLKEGDQITVGKTDLMFIPFCREDRTWEKE